MGIFFNKKSPTLLNVINSTFNPFNMRKLLLFLTALFVTYITSAQVPANDLIENAIEIDPSNYLEENIRLDLATTSGFENALCATGVFNKVFYKFTATADVRISAELTDMIGNPISQSFLIFYTAPDLNQTDETQLTLVSDCTFGVSAITTVTSGQSYYFQVHRDDVSAFSRISVAQGPPNDSISEAIEITGSAFNDDNLRLDLASPNLGGQIGCAVGNFTTAYYKFTANASGSVTFFLFDSQGGPNPTNSFIIIYSAADLNATSDTELTVYSNCSFDVQPTINIVAGQSYYVLVNRPDAGALSNFSVSLPQTVPANERQALIDFYNATDGPNWGINTNWTTSAPVSTWAGITVENGHVSAMGLINVGATGTLPNSIFNLPFLESFVFENNDLTGVIPDLTSLTNLETFNIRGNQFTFEHLEPNFTQNSTLSEFLYANQQRINEQILIDNPVIGQEYTLNTTAVGTNLSYQWVKDEGGFLLEIEEIPGATNADYVIPSLQVEDIFSYSCRVTSAIIPDLTLVRNTIKLRIPVSQSERDALVALYNACDGPNWADNENWLSTMDVDDWAGVQTVGGKVIVLNQNFQNLNGQIPDEIGDLIYLKEIRISVNPNLTGPIPSTIGNLTDLEFLRFQLNSMSGDIPASVSNLTNLTRVYLQDNQFTGSIPSGFGNAPDLFQIFLMNNQLDGNIPTSIGNLNQLVSFDVSNNNMSGTLPTELGNLSSILLFGIANNDFSGALPDWSGINEPENANFDLVNNYFDFSDLEPLVNNGVSYNSLFYTPQRTLDQEQEIMSPPGANIELNVDDVTIDRDADDTASSNQYQWFKDNVAISGANSSIYTIVNAQIADSGIYYCEITNTLLPELTIVRANITVIVDENLSLGSFENEDFKLYPNPAKDWITIQGPIASEAKAEIYDINGKLVFEKQLSSQITGIAVDQLAVGTYIVKITSNNKTQTKRFIKQ